MLTTGRDRSLATRSIDEPIRLRLAVEYLNLLTTSKGAFVCASMACTALLCLLAPIRLPKRSIWNRGNETFDAIFGGIAASAGFLAIGNWCLPDGTRLFEAAGALGLVGAVWAYRLRKRLQSLTGDADAFNRANSRLQISRWVLFPVSVALVTYTSLFA